MRDVRAAATASELHGHVSSPEDGAGWPAFSRDPVGHRVAILGRS